MVDTPGHDLLQPLYPGWLCDKYLSWKEKHFPGLNYLGEILRASCFEQNDLEMFWKRAVNLVVPCPIFCFPLQTNFHKWPNQWRKLFSDDIILNRIAAELYPSFASFCRFKQFYLFHGEGAILICSCFYELFYCSLRKKATNHNNFCKIAFSLRWAHACQINISA